MAAAKSKRQSRKRRRAGPPAPERLSQAARPPRGPLSEVKAERRVRAERQRRRGNSAVGAFGERPESPFGGLPISELAIFVGAIGAVVGFVAKAPAALAVGLVACTLGVVEFTAREHFSGYRSHATLLAAIPSIGAGIAMIALLGGSLRRGLLLPVVLVVFLVCFWLLRRRFRIARQARVARPPL